MDIAAEYRKIYNSEMLPASKGIIFLYNPATNKYNFKPFSHNIGEDCVERLSSLMRKNLLFYCYGEDEVIHHYQRGTFSSLEQAAKYAYKNRLPKRLAESDGLPGEVLLDLLIQLYENDTYKLAVRPIMRQNDNNEIKGYDLAYFTLSDGQISLWLGQAKLGQKNYCKSGIHEDLLDKFQKDYLSNQVFFVCDKQIGLTEESLVITDMVNKINVITIEEDETKRETALLQCFKQNNVSINIPCLMAYEESEVYCDASCIVQKIDEELLDIQRFFMKKSYFFSGFSPNIIIYIFPIKDVQKLRDNSGGFYSGLR